MYLYGQHPPTLLFPTKAAVSLTCCGGAASNGCPTYSVHHAYCPVNNTVTGGLIALARDWGEGGGCCVRLKSHNWKIALRSVFEWAAWRQWCISLDEENLSPETLVSVTGRFSIVALSHYSRSIDNIQGPRKKFRPKVPSGLFWTPSISMYFGWTSPPQGYILCGLERKNSFY